MGPGLFLNLVGEKLGLLSCTHDLFATRKRIMSFSDENCCLYDKTRVLLELCVRQLLTEHGLF